MSFHRAFHRALIFLALALCILLPAEGVLAQLQDAAGSKDHPMIKRFEGSAIIGYEALKFNDFLVLLGPVKGKFSEVGGIWWEYEQRREALPLTPTKTQKVEGEATRILYVAPQGRSPLEVLRNYERELQRLGFQTLFKCAREECSSQDGALGWLYLYPPKRRFQNTPPLSVFALTQAIDQQFMTAKRTSSGADVYVSVYVAKSVVKNISGGDYKETFGRAITLLDVVETVPMENKMVTIDAAVMAKEVADTGHVALYGIYFDTNKTDIKPESAPAIDEIAKFLKQDPRAIVYVVGHTDNVGGYEHNMGLSQRRAEAVVKELTTRHGIPGTRLKAAGTGPLAPMASNETEEGRAKNRRVELVKQ
jgi:outer membrane protein OmpA-like peptidoglycan-associated protein